MVYRSTVTALQNYDSLYLANNILVPVGLILSYELKPLASQEASVSN